MAAYRRRSRANSIALSLSELGELIHVSSYDLNKEEDRKRTFVENDWSNPAVNPDDLALIGFFFYKKPDFVRCHFCEVVLGQFETGDIPLAEHQNFSPYCPLLKKRNTGNVPISQSAFDEMVPEPVHDEFGLPSMRRRRSRSRAGNDDGIAYPEYKILQERIKSFKMWPVGLKQRPQALAEAGFFYSGQSDLVICFSCGLFLCQWRPEDNVWIEHKSHATKECNYLNLNHETVKLNEQKHEAEVKRLNSEACESTSEQAAETSTEAPLDENDRGEGSNYESLCKICLEKKSNVIFLPCRHVAVCGTCVFGLNDKCPICRAEVKEKIDLFYA